MPPKWLVVILYVLLTLVLLLIEDIDTLQLQHSTNASRVPVMGDR